MRPITVIFLALCCFYASSYTPSTRFHRILRKNSLKRDVFVPARASRVDDTTIANDNSSMKWNYGNVLLFTPLLSPLVAFLFSEISNPMISGTERQLYVLGLLLFKRLYLYFSALGIVDLSSRYTSSNFVSNIGERLRTVNEELLPGYAGSLNASADSVAVYESLDAVEESTAALWLPVALAGSLLGSLALLAATGGTSLPNLGVELPFAATLSSSAQSIAVIANFAVCVLFTKAVLTNSVREFGFEKLSGIASVAAVAITGLGFLLPPGGTLWPVHNVINACVCVSVSRLLQLRSLTAVLLALSGLVLYDVVAVSGTQMLSDNGQSVMEAVATAKLGLAQLGAAPSESQSSIAPLAASISEVIDASSIWDKLSSIIAGPGAFSWRPGLLEVSTGGRVSDALGLGDVVFPAILSGWSLRRDKEAGTAAGQVGMIDESQADPSRNAKRRSLYSASLVGYFLGCLLCDVFMTGNGQPALLYIVPSMAVSVMATATLNGELFDVFKTEKED